jgi:hypothetical protein
MTRLSRLLGLGLAGLTVLSLGACGEDGGKDTPPEPGAVDSGADVPETPANPRPLDGGAARMDATVTPPRSDGAVDEPPTSDGAVDTTPDPLPDGAVPVTTTQLPSDGNKLSVCYGEADCNGDDLTCYLPGDAAPGLCTDDCSQDSDCPAVEGIAQGCSTFGQCRIDCTGTGSGDGACPANQVCRDTSGPGLLTPPAYRCTYPVGAGSKAVALYGKCNTNHGGGDCQGMLGCHVPSALLFAPEGPGYCSNACTVEADCALPAGVTSTVMCLDGGCEFDCSRAGASCPSAMNCRDIDPSPLEDYRCRMID